MTKLPYDPKKLKRELDPYYIPASKEEISQMLATLGMKKLDDLYEHIPGDLRYKEEKHWGSSLEYNELAEHLESVSKMNNLRLSFIGDGLKQYKVSEIVPIVSNVRGLTTAYTPYQPERAQGTLQSLWVYSSVMSMLTGFEAVNASLYDRSTALFEALNCARKIKRNTKTALVCDSIYPGDRRVLESMIQNYEMDIQFAPINAKTGTTDIEELKNMANKIGKDLCAIAFPHVNSLGNLEDVDLLTDLSYELGVQSVAVVDPMLLAAKGLKRPSDYGSKGEGAHILVGEAQHLAIGPGFGGPGLGMFAIRYNDKNKNSVRSTPGRFLSKAKDNKGRDALTLVLSTREQHIRRDKATSNICSNQSFMASLVGASCLHKGDAGLSASITKGRSFALKMAKELTRFKGVELAYPQTPFFNEFVLALPLRSTELLDKARAENIHLGVDVSSRTENKKGNHLLISFFDIHEESDLKKLLSFFEKEFGKASKEGQAPQEIPSSLLRKEAPEIPQFSTSELKSFYEKLGKQNATPDDNIYALGSCTMKYNPYINDYTAGLKGFTDVHPQAPEEDIQGCLHILYETQEMFKGMLGLAAVTTHPVAGAHGEYVALKMFQAYHRENGEEELRDVMLIPHSAHGTNPASAAEAGFKEIVEINANATGTVDISHLQELVSKYGNRIAGIMVTNPNTSGVFECEFKKIADMVHAVGGLVYMDGANLNAIAGWIDLNKMGVDAIHSNLHKTWSVPHGGGGPGDAIVAVSQKLKDFLPGEVVIKENHSYKMTYAPKTIGFFHRHHGNFLHKIRCYTYLKALGSTGTRMMTATAVLAANYLHHHLSEVYPSLPFGAEQSRRMHEFIMTLSEESFSIIEKKGGVPHAEAIPKIGKLFLDFGLHAPTVAFPEVYGLMVEPTESYTKAELDRFIDIVKAIFKLITETPQVLQTVPHFTPVNKIDEVSANKTPVFAEKLTSLPKVYEDQVDVAKINQMSVGEICKIILAAHEKAKAL